MDLKIAVEDKTTKPLIERTLSLSLTVHGNELRLFMGQGKCPTSTIVIYQT